MDISKEQITRAEEVAESLQAILAHLIEDCSDYDIERVLKRSEAEAMDLRHNLSLVRRLITEAS